jgi:peptidyl-prolyl cis-trans isomerase D
MLRGIRTASANWLGKLVMGVVVGFLALSFAIWGIGDIFRGFGTSALATVGSTDITSEQFRQVYNERLQQISTQLGRPIPPDQVRALGLDRQILGQMIGEVALDEWGRRMGLGITDAEVARLIRTFPAFQGPDGKFDHALFLARVRNAGYTEPRFVNEQRRLMIRSHLTETIGGVTSAPKTFLDAVNSFQNEQRSIEYVTLGPAQAGEIAPPTPEDLAGYFEARKTLFRAPEYRKLILLRLSQDDLMKWATVSDADARAFYEARRSRYTTPGRRHLQQIVFPSADEAKRAKERIDAGTSFLDIAKERGLSEQDIDLGFVARGALATAPAVAEAAFSLPEGAVSGPVQSRLGTALIRIVKAEADSVKPFEEVQEEIRTEMARDRSRAEMTEKHDKIEDERAGGANLTEVAQKVGLTPLTIEAVDRSGRDPSGAVVPLLPAGIDVLTPAFATGKGVEADAIRLEGGGYLWFEVADITPSKERTLEEVKDRVEARWRDDQIGERLRKKSAEMLERLKAGEAFGAVAAANDLKVETASDLRRNARADNLSPAAIAIVFRTPKDTVAGADGMSASERLVLRVTDIKVPPVEAEAPDVQQLEQTIRNALSEDLLRQYIVYVERTLGTRINADALRRVVGGEAL